MTPAATMPLRRLILLIFCIINVSSSQNDLCNYHGTLFETETFFLTQPYSKNITIDLENYQATFQNFPHKIDTFANLFKQYETANSLSLGEPLQLIPFTKDLNVFKTPSETTGRKSLSDCNKYNGSLLALTNSNKPRVLEIMKELQLEKIPFTSLPFQNVLSYPSLEILDDSPDAETLEAVWAKTPVFLTKTGLFEYPTPIALGTTTVSPNALEKQKIFALCTKPNNPWDLDSRKNWLNLVPQIKNAIKVLQNLKHVYTQTANTLSKLPQSPVSDISRNIKLILPDPLKAIVNFLDLFSNKKQWESSQSASLALFSNFVKETFKAIRLFNLDSSITNIKDKQIKKFRLLDFNDLHWKDFFDLDEELYGMSGPVTVTPFNKHPEEISTKFEANVRFRIFNRQIDKYTIFKFRPNIILNQIANIKNILHSSKYTLALKEDLIPQNCHKQPAENHQICHKLPAIVYDHDHNRMVECGLALFNPQFNEKHTFCPLTAPSIDPAIYRADCNTDQHSSLIISSTKPVSLAFFCDSTFKENKNFTRFPERIQTDCEARLLDSGIPSLVVPQRNHDFLQNPDLGPILSYFHPQLVQPAFNLIFHVIIPVVSGIILLFIFIIISLWCYFRKKETQNPPIQSGTLRIVQNRPNVIELQQLASNRRLPQLQINEYPLLN